MKYSLLAILAIFIAGTLGFMYRQQIMSLLTKNTAPEIAEVRDFQCEGMEGFTFKYPVFKGWSQERRIEVEPGKKCKLFFMNLADQRGYIIAVTYDQINNRNDGSLFPAPPLVPTKDARENINGVLYDITRPDMQGNAIYFYYNFRGDGFYKNMDMMSVESSGLPEYNDVFRQQVIESFRISSNQTVENFAPKFAGNWKWRDEKYVMLEKDDGTKEYQEASLYLNIEIDASINLIGEWTAAMRGGNRVDICKNEAGDKPCLSGVITGGEVTMDFEDGYRGGRGRLKLVYDSQSDTLHWKILERPQGEFYLPVEAILERIPEPYYI
ncbi:hypothetical protein HYV30_02900 [Candidatus Kaiserbacteria bacterium]|nr:hypothetical protein [Candidatus Kaiserbacteria bacterium]